MDDLTIFTIPRAFRGHNAIVQNNALKSWTLLVPPPKIILCGRERGMEDAARRYGAHQQGIHKDKQWGLPLVSSAFGRVQKHAATRLLAFVNTDIILLEDFMPAVELVAKKFKRFLMIGRKTDVRVTRSLEFTRGWQGRLRSLAERKGKLHGPAGLDYFVFTRGVYKTIPPFIIGRRGWDNWLAWEPGKRGISVVDASKAVLAFHQQRLGRKTDEHPAVAYNRKLAGEAGTWGRTDQVFWRIMGKEVVRIT